MLFSCEISKHWSQNIIQVFSLQELLFFTGLLKKKNNIAIFVF